MNDDQNEARDDGLERTISESLDAQAARLGDGGVGLDAIYARVEQRRNRRRAVAAVGSIAIVGAGVLGVAALGSDDKPTMPAVQDGALGALSSDADTVPAGSPVWRCEQPLAIDFDTSGATYFESCEQVALTADAWIVPVPVTTFVPAYPECIEPPVPTTTVPTSGTAPDVTPVPVCVPAPGTESTEMPVTPTTITCFAPPTSVEVSVPNCPAGTVPPTPAIDTAFPTTTTTSTTTTSTIAHTVTTEPPATTTTSRATTAPPTTATDR